ncbi:tetraacyldisaccharide 4'-kinase [Marinobacter orientalis]|uniref:Tetraacyldisaccharide 4'-kinase n=1 Tax=Marinobacter orientalis TaxID=1928859 RepID=A0A7Y0RCX5_9GAMM|nr:tetraacyldisaccharide 4'-kinase [Marinobacter orientalis]NMT63920.1 tetraacyldisaccharide 4'-kinase [Marinobacter orientalis]TGX50018.1 tetraacyldisaccharide 4'-kinase [Marinobacter orientalis]
MTALVDRLWYGDKRPLWPLYPLAWLYRAIAENRRRRAWLARNENIPVPVVVVGNITAGGTGKSPLTSALVRLLRERGWQPVILSRGYGGKADRYPLLVTPETGPDVAGDEPVMLAAESDCPVVVDPDRKRGALWALDQKLGNILVCDDGLQHYRLPRDIELAVFDAARGIGNGALIPVGPLREPLERLASVDFVIANGGHLGGIEHEHQFTMNLAPTELRNLVTGDTLSPDRLRGQPVRAVAGIGNPARFFDTLKGLGAQVRPRALPDHHRFTPEDLQSEQGEWLVMTAKDAVKCRGFAHDNAWVLAVKAGLPESFAEAFMASVNHCRQSPDSNETVRTHHG